MNSRERVLAAINKKKPDRTPRLLYGEIIGYVPKVAEQLEKHCGKQNPIDYFDMDITKVNDVNPTKLNVERFYPWHHQTNFPIDEWGVGWESGSLMHFARIVSPLESVSDFDKIKSYPWPDFDEEYRYFNIAEKVKAVYDRGKAVAVFAGSVFEQSWYIRGMAGF